MAAMGWIEIVGIAIGSFGFIIGLRLGERGAARARERRKAKSRE